jgi:hypothetical protein
MYPKIETLYERNQETHKLIEPLVLKNPTYDLVKKWVFSEKIDGTNIRVLWEPEHETFGDINGPNITKWPDHLRFADRTDNAKLDGYKSLMKYLNETFTAEKLRSTFTGPVVLYGEGYGAGINKGGGYRTDQSFILFDVFVLDNENPFRGWWLNDEDMRAVAQGLNIDAVPFICYTELELATEMVRTGFKSRLGTADAEGLVGRPAETLYDKRGRRIIIKIKTKDFEKPEVENVR